MDGKEIPAVHYTRHEAEEPSGLREDIDVYEPTLRGEKDTARICKPNHQFIDYFSSCYNTQFTVNLAICHKFIIYFRLR